MIKKESKIITIAAQEGESFDKSNNIVDIEDSEN